VTEYFKEKKRILCVIGSGDQILNALTFFPEKIVGFDISVFPKFFLKLKLAGIMSLSRDEFIEFFFDVNYNSNEDFYDDIFFYKIFPYLDEQSKNFWGFLFEYNEWYDIYNSPLFSSEVVIVKRALEQNVYLKEEKYKELKEIIPKVKIDFIVADIINTQIENDFDLIYLSNIMQYENVWKYKEKVKELTRNRKTEVLTYVFGEIDRVLEFFNDTKTVGINFNKNGILIHK